LPWEKLKLMSPSLIKVMPEKFSFQISERFPFTAGCEAVGSAAFRDARMSEKQPSWENMRDLLSWARVQTALSALLI